MKAIRKNYSTEGLRSFRIIDVPAMEDYPDPNSSCEARENFMYSLPGESNLGSNESISLVEDREAAEWLEYEQQQGWTDEDSTCGTYELQT